MTQVPPGGGRWAVGGGRWAMGKGGGRWAVGGGQWARAVGHGQRMGNRNKGQGQALPRDPRAGQSRDTGR